MCLILVKEIYDGEIMFLEVLRKRRLKEIGNGLVRPH